MPKESTVLRKYYHSAFLLDKPKASRILNILEQRFGEIGKRFDPQFDIELANRKRVSLTSSELLFSLDNAVKNPITSLRIAAPSEPSGKSELQEASIDLEYGSGLRRSSASINLSVESKNSKWANELFAELEEQIERTVLRTFVYKYVKTGVVFAVAVLLLLPLLAVFMPPEDEPARDNDLTVAEAQYLARKADLAKTDQEKIDFIFELDKSRIKNRMHARKISGGVLTAQSLFVAIPILSIAAIAAYVILRCYPNRIFAWGDYGEYYQGLVARRRTLWTVIVAAFLVGVVANLFVLGLPRIK